MKLQYEGLRLKCQQDTTPDYYARYRTTAYPDYNANTPDYYGRYASGSASAGSASRYQEEDQYAQRSTPDYYAEALARSTSLQGYTAPPADTGDAGVHWSPYWEAATVASSGGNGDGQGSAGK